MNVRYRVNRWALIGLWSAILCSTLMYATALRAQSGPTLQIVAPANGTTVDRPVTIRVEHTGIRFDGIQVGGNNEAGVGHWHIYVDDQFAGLSPTNVIELPNDAYPTITAGRHRITATLSENNHAPLNPPVTQTIEINFSKEVSIPVSQSGTPSVTVVFPTANASIDAPFVARIEHAGFRMDGINSGKDPVPGTGHWHINVDGRYAGMSVSNVMELPNDSFPTITAGQHTLTFYVHQNNHVATNPPVAASIRINVTRDLTVGAAQATVGPTQTTAAGGGQTGATPTTAAPGTTPTTRATGTPVATATTQGTTSPNTTASAQPSATVGLPGIPNTGEVAANITLPTSIAIICLIIGSMLLYWSRMGGLDIVTSGGSGRQINLGLGSGFANALERMVTLTGARSSERFGFLIERLKTQPLVIRINISAHNLMRARTAMAFSGGAITGFSVSALFILLWTSQPTYFAQPAVVQSPAEVAVAPITAPGTTQMVGSASEALPWPATLPRGMALSIEDSWPLQVLDAKHAAEPFLVFRDGERSVIVRYADDAVAGTTKPMQIAGTDGEIQSNADGSFRATWQQDGRTLEMSGAGLSEADISNIASSVTALDATQLQDYLVRDAAHRFVNITLLWPEYLPAGVNLQPGESTVSFSPLGTIPNGDRYRLVFRGGDATVQIGGGKESVPTMAGTVERFQAGAVTGQLTAGDRRFLLVLDTGNAEQATLSFAPLIDNHGRQLPMLQQGKVYVSAENIDRTQFDRIVAGLFAMRAPEFEAQARGQSLSSLSYMWPNKLPEGFKLDLTSASYADANAILRGEHARFAVNATGPDGATLSIKGGREADGSPFVVPEGQTVEQIMTTINGRGATAAKTETGNIVIWSNGTSTYEITSATVALEQLVAVAQSMTRVDPTTWQRNTITGPTTAPGVTNPLPLDDTNSTTVFGSALLPVAWLGTQSRVMGEKIVPTPEPKKVVVPAAPDRIVIPALDMDQPIFSVDATVPKHNVGWYKHSGRPGQGTNVVMWGHVMRWKDSPEVPAPFADLHLLGPGAKIIVVSATGERFSYVITKQIRVTPDKVSYLAPTEHEQLLLVSCIGDKIVVNGELTKAERLLTIAEPVE